MRPGGCSSAAGGRAALRALIPAWRPRRGGGGGDGSPATHSHWCALRGEHGRSGRGARCAVPCRLSAPSRARAATEHGASQRSAVPWQRLLATIDVRLAGTRCRCRRNDAAARRRPGCVSNVRCERNAPRRPAAAAVPATARGRAGSMRRSVSQCMSPCLLCYAMPLAAATPSADRRALAAAHRAGDRGLGLSVAEKTLIHE
eukprot:280903-Chlamydomonas_euryale.AAC.2